MAWLPFQKIGGGVSGLKTLISKERFGQMLFVNVSDELSLRL